MKINKLVVTFFIVIGLLTEIHGAEKHESYIDIDNERIQQIESQISSLQIERDQIKQHQGPSINDITMHNSIPLDVEKQDQVSYIKWERIGCYTCTALTSLAVGASLMYYYFVPHYEFNFSENLFFPNR